MTSTPDLVWFAPGHIRDAIQGPEMGWTHPEEEQLGRQKALEGLRALTDRLHAVEGQFERLMEAAVEAWHTSDSGKPLHEFLGMSWYEYARWVENPKAIYGRYECAHGHRWLMLSGECQRCPDCNTSTYKEIP